jgi:hypothetical protein
VWKGGLVEVRLMEESQPGRQAHARRSVRRGLGMRMVCATWVMELGERGTLPHGPGGFVGCGWLLVHRVLWICLIRKGI